MITAPVTPTGLVTAGDESAGRLPARDAMPLQNRVDPYGLVHAVPARGAWMGNRGVLHDESKRIVAQWRLTRWIICALSFKGRRGEVFAPRRYSQLFFLDEATAFAAGHRPCAECRRDRYNEFRDAWLATGPGRAANRRSSAEAMDRVLHSERMLRGGGKRTHRAELGTLPDGTMVEFRGQVHLIWNGGLRPWSFTGYGRPVRAIPSAAEVEVLTPETTIRVFRAGFRPQVHESAG